ncbi:MAG TPA: tetratricopeptide repeat protein [Gemmatimonadota bacterium]|nr:tetratricopeptide repeat protein [Gemmatimonadota bacterium]
MRIRQEVVWSAAAMALLFLLPLFVGCSGDDGTSASARAGRTGERTAQLPPEVTLPPPIEATAVEEVTVEPVVVKPEPPREVTYAEAESVFLNRNYDEATELFVLYSERRPENPWGYYMLGLSAWKSGQHGLAESAFQQALELDPLHVKSWINLSRVLLDQERAEEALQLIDEALALSPESSVGYRLQGRALHQLGRLDDAIDSYRQAILIDHGDVWSMNNMGLILIEQERFIEALLPLARAVGLEPEVPIFHNNLGVALERTGHYRAAEDAFRSVLALDETYMKAEISLLRVEEMVEDVATLPVDLTELAQSFVDEVEGWREAVAYREFSDPVTLDDVDPVELVEPIVVSLVDTMVVDTVPVEPQVNDTTKVEGLKSEGNLEREQEHEQK